MPRPLPPYLHRERTRHGQVVYYVRREHGPRIRIKAVFGTPEFFAQYQEALKGQAPPNARGPKPGTIEWALKRYMASSAWSGLSPATRGARENIFHHIVAAAGDKLLSQVSRNTIIGGREKRQKTLHAANNYLKAMRGFFAWAAGDGGLVKENPRGIRGCPQLGVRFRYPQKYPQICRLPTDTPRHPRNLSDPRIECL